jgi:DNA repair protein RadD
MQVRRGSSVAILLLSYFSLTEPEKAAEPEAPACEIQGGYELFPHQRVAARDVSRMLHEAPHRVLLHMPTGSGKTRTAMSYVAGHLRGTEEGLVLWLAAAEELCDQAADEFADAWKKLGNRKISIHRWWGANEIGSEVPRDGFAVAGLAKIYSRGVNDPPWLARLGDRTTLMVFDEAHQAIAPTFRHVVEAIAARREGVGLLGLSATPGRTWNDVGEDQKLSEFFSKKKVTLKIRGYPNPIEYLVEEGYLARPTYRAIEHQGPELSEADRAALASQLDIPRTVLRRLADDHLRNLYIANEVRSLARRHHRIIVFSTTVEHAEMLSVVLQAQGVPTRAVTAATGSTERASAIRWYRQHNTDETRVLTNYGVLTTGFDAPKTSAALIARPTKSLVLYSQMVGRAIRGPRAGGNREAEIVTVVDTGLPGFRSLSESFANWEDVWTQ